MPEANEEKSILEWESATYEEKQVAKRVAEDIGRTHFAFNLPLQMWFEKDEETDEISCRMLNYMPRKEQVCDLQLSELYDGKMPTKEQFRDFCDTTIAIYKNLIRKFEALRDGKIDTVYYPNSDTETEIRSSENQQYEWEVVVNPYKK